MAKKRKVSLFYQKILIFGFLILFFYATNVYILGQKSAALSFGEQRTAQELLWVWGNEGEVYPAGKLEKLDLNEATEEEFILLPEIGEVLAKRILEYRDEIDGFSSIFELDNVKGIGEKTIAAIIDYICV